MRRDDWLFCAASAALVQPGHSDSTQISIIEGRLQRSQILALRRLTLAGFSYALAGFSNTQDQLVAQTGQSVAHSYQIQPDLC